MADVSAGSFLATGTLRSLHQDRLYQIRVCWAQAQDQEEWKPLALMVAEFEASTPARFNHGPRAVQYVPPPQPDPDARAAVSHLLPPSCCPQSTESSSGYTDWLEGVPGHLDCSR